MIKRIRYNQLKRIRFIVSIITFTAFMLLLLSSDLYPKYEITIQIFISLALIFHTSINTLFLHRSITKKQCFEDELSKENDKLAAQFTLHILVIFLMTIPLILFSFNLSIPIRTDTSFIIYMALIAVNDGFYLCLEKRDISYAEINDEN